MVAAGERDADQRDQRPASRAGSVPHARPRPRGGTRRSPQQQQQQQRRRRRRSGGGSRCVPGRRRRRRRHQRGDAAAARREGEDRRAAEDRDRATARPPDGPRTTGQCRRRRRRQFQTELRRSSTAHDRRRPVATRILSSGFMCDYYMQHAAIIAGFPTARKGCNCCSMSHAIIAHETTALDIIPAKCGLLVDSSKPHSHRTSELNKTLSL